MGLYTVFLDMGLSTKIDRAGRLVIPKELRDLYGLDEGTEIELVAVPDGITLIPARAERRIVRRGRVVAIDTGAGPGTEETFAVHHSRDNRLTRTAGFSQ